MRCPEGRSKSLMLIDTMAWDGTPEVTFRKSVGNGELWDRAEVSDVHFVGVHLIVRFRPNTFNNLDRHLI